MEAGRSLIRTAQVGLALFALGGVAACGGTAASGGSGDAGGPIKIGIVGPMSGGSAAFGKEFPVGAKYAQEWIESKGLLGDRKVEFTIIDDQSKPDAAVAAVREATDKGIHIFVGTINSPVALALAPVMEQTDSVLITTAAHAMEMTHEKFSKNVFRATDNPYMRHMAQAKLALEVAPDAKRWSLMGPDHSYGVSTMRSFKAGLNKYGTGLTIGQAVRTPFGAPDYRNALSSVQAQKPQAIFSSEYAADAVTADTQAKEMGLWDTAQLFDSNNGFFVARAMKQDVPTHWTADHWYPGAYDNEMTKFITERYAKQFNNYEATGFVATSFTGVLLVAEAVKAKAGSTATADLIAAMEGIKIQTPNGELEIRAEDHQGVKDINFWKIEGCASCEHGYKVVDHRTYPGRDFIEPPTPGKAFDYGPNTEL